MPAYPGVYVEEVELPKSIEGVSSTKGFVGSIRRGVDAIAKAAAVVVLGMLLGVVASIAVDKWRRRRSDFLPRLKSALPLDSQGPTPGSGPEPR